MQQYIIERKEDIIAGLLTFAIGLFVLIGGMSYDIGTLRQMGPGYFPVILGVAMILLGIGILVFASPSEKEPPSQQLKLRGILFVAAGIASFALTIETVGMIPAVFLAVFLSSLSNKETPLLTSIILALATAIITFVLFRYGLDLQFEGFK